MIDLFALAEQLVSLTVKQVNELAKILKEQYGIEPAAAAVEAVVEKTEFDVVLSSAGAAKLTVVKEVKNILGLGLKEAKDLVDGAPATLKTGVSKDEANTIKAALEAAGATIEVK